MAENKLTTMTDLGEIKSIDFVNKFSKNLTNGQRTLTQLKPLKVKQFRSLK